MRFISTRVHGTIDYATALVLIVVPIFFIDDAGWAAWTLIVAGVLLLGLSLLTRYEVGAIKTIPMPVHLAMDGVLGVVLIASPWIFGFADVIWWPHVAVGVLEIGAALFTEKHSSTELGRDWEAAPQRR